MTAAVVVALLLPFQRLFHFKAIFSFWRRSTKYYCCCSLMTYIGDAYRPSPVSTFLFFVFLRYVSYNQSLVDDSGVHEIKKKRHPTPDKGHDFFFPFFSNIFSTFFIIRQSGFLDEFVLFTFKKKKQRWDRGVRRSSFFGASNSVCDTWIASTTVFISPHAGYT